MRIPVILAVAASLVLWAGALEAAPQQRLDTDAFVAACVSDEVVVALPGLEAGSKITPKAYCDCVAGKLQESKVGQADIDMLTKVHKDELTDEDAKYPTLEDLLSDNEGFEDECKESLGLPAADTDEMPGDDLVPFEEGEPD